MVAGVVSLPATTDGLQIIGGETSQRGRQVHGGPKQGFASSPNDINIEPDAESLAEIAILAADAVERARLVPRSMSRSRNSATAAPRVERVAATRSAGRRT